MFQFSPPGDPTNNAEAVAERAATLTVGEGGKQVWVWKDAEMGMSGRILAMHAEAPDMSQAEIAAELGCNRSTVSRALKTAKVQGTESVQ